MPKPRHARDVLREVHRALVKEGVRDQITLVASGGIAQAEHVAKAIICGADLVAIDVPLLLALDCRLCGQCEQGEDCPVALEEVEAEYAVRRIENLVGAWHQQLIEVLGAMGIREVRRLRGETGRAMFFEDLERDSFGRLFGKRKESLAPTASPANELDMSVTLENNAVADAPAADDFLTRPDYAEVAREVRPAPPRYRNEIGKYSIRRASTCVNCGRCVELCPEGVHRRPEGYKHIIRPMDYRCLGPECEKTDHYCIAACPQQCSRSWKIRRSPRWAIAAGRRT